MNVLLTKLASMGDLVHLLPALTDAKKAIPSLSFDWVIDKHFQEIALWHPAVKRRILTEHRKWRSSLFSKQTRQEIAIMLETLRTRSYDLVIDAHGNFKSALIGCCAKKKSLVGWDGSSIPEWGAHFLYTKSYPVSKKQHSIDRLRQLLAASFGYTLSSSSPDYGIDKSKISPPSSIEIPPNFLLMVPIASTKEKLWTETAWKELITQSISAFSLPILLPWGSPAEKERAQRLSNNNPYVQVLPKLSLTELAYLLSKSQAVVSLDTGLSHIAAALGTPTLTLYGRTDPYKTGTIGLHQHWLRAEGNNLSSLSATEVFPHLTALLSLGR